MAEDDKAGTTRRMHRVHKSSAIVCLPAKTRSLYHHSQVKDTIKNPKPSTSVLQAQAKLPEFSRRFKKGISQFSVGSWQTEAKRRAPEQYNKHRKGENLQKYSLE